MHESHQNTGKRPEMSEFVHMQDEKIRKNLRRIRLSKSMKVVEIAKRMNMSTNQYSNLELGKSKLNLLQLFSIVEILECPMDQVFDFVEEFSTSLKDEIEQLKMEIARLKDHNRLLMKEANTPRETLL